MPVSDAEPKLRQSKEYALLSDQYEASFPYLTLRTYWQGTRLDAMYPLWLRLASCLSGRNQQGRWVASFSH